MTEGRNLEASISVPMSALTTKHQSTLERVLIWTKIFVFIQLVCVFVDLLVRQTKTVSSIADLDSVVMKKVCMVEHGTNTQ